MLKVLVTGTAGFIGFHLVRRLFERGDEITGLDNINDYYGVRVKHLRLKETGISHDAIKYNKYVESAKYPNYRFIKLDLDDAKGMRKVFDEGKFDTVINLAAQAGVRYSLKNPQAYIQSNIVGFLNVLEGCKHGVEHLVFASSSSVYGPNTHSPLSTDHSTDHPGSTYAATKKSNELLAHAYSHLYGLPTTGIRFFTVYGPWGRPDMAPFIFTKAILENKPIDLFNHGRMERDFTYIDDAIDGAVRIMDHPPVGNSSKTCGCSRQNSSPTPFKVYNIGSDSPIGLLDFISILEKKLGKPVKRNMLPMQPGDVQSTHADILDAHRDLGYTPKTSIEEGVGRFIDWYMDYCK